MTVHEQQYSEDDDDVDDGDTKSYYESDQEVTEDEEVKRNCIMGQSGMRDSDFSDSNNEDDENEDETVEDADDDENCCNHNKKTEDQSTFQEKERLDELVKFVSIGGQIPKSQEGMLYWPTPIRNALISECRVEKERNDDDEEKEYCESSDDSEENCNLHTYSMDAKSHTMKLDNKNEISDNSSNSSDNGDDTESMEVDTQIIMGSSPTNFPFDREDAIVMKVTAVGVVTTISETEQSYDSSDQQQQEPEITNGNCAIIGASGASVDDIKWQRAKQKRVLSSNTLATLNQEIDHHIDSTKRMRCSRSYSRDHLYAIPIPIPIPEITLGIEALDQIIQPLPQQYLIRDDSSSLILYSSEEEEDKRLSEELEEKSHYDTMGGDNSPIPLLTPPLSPRTINDDTEGIGTTMMTVIEWPSNLVMDNAVMKAANLSSITLDNTRL